MRERDGASTNAEQHGLMADGWDTMIEIFEQARKIPRDDRAAFLDEACRSYPDIRADLDLMLHHYKGAPGFFEDLSEVVPTPNREDPSPEAETQAEADPYNLINRLIADYTVTKKLGAGGMGVVYEAFDIQLERVMALKFLSPELSGNIEARRRFFAEARAASALDHPNICAIERVGETEEGHLYIAMRYYPGETLAAKMARGALPPEEALDYAAQMARALNQAHARGIVHRDIKPSNVMITKRTGEEEIRLVKILDFGVAKMEDLGLTQGGHRIGTITYMSPEQIRGDTVDHRTDIWALGVVLYEMLTGEHPFKGNRYEIIHLVLDVEPTLLTEHNPALPEDLERVVMKCLEKEKENRFSSASDLRAALKACLNTSLIRSGTPPSP